MINIQSIPKSLKNKRVSVIGMGISGIGAAKLLKHCKADVFVSDLGNSIDIHENSNHLSDLKIPFETGKHSEKVFDCELMVVSPGIGKETSVLRKAQKLNIPIIGEIELGSWFTEAPIIAVTGSNGKTTTSKLLASMCQNNDFDGVLAGNIGVSFSEKILQDIISLNSKRVFILEISSFQTEYLVHLKPYISIFLNITPDHLNRHGTFDNYLNAKIKLAENQDRESFGIFNEDDNHINVSIQKLDLKKIPFSLDPERTSYFGLNDTKIIKKNHDELISLANISLIGNHNYSNIIAAATAAHLLGVNDTHIAESIQKFKPIPHRMEEFHTKDGIQYINDSKATNIDSVKCALNSFNKPIILILGGKYKGGNFEDLLPHTKNIKAIIAYGEAQEIIVNAFRDAVRLEAISNLKQAVILTQSIARPGEVVLLSPGCASFDQFKNFEERGNCFKKWVLKEA